MHFARFPRVRLAHLPTPLEPMEALTKHFGGPKLYVKRDDCTGLATGGNKTRKLEFLMAAALAEGADTIVTQGAVQSNHCRQSAAAAAKLGIERLIFPLSGNGTGDINNYAKAIAAICEAQEKEKPVLVHCAAGVQRTGGVIATYRLLVEKKDTPFVLAEMMHYGWNPRRNVHLLPYLNSNMAKLAKLLQQMGVIDDVPASLPQLGPAE